MDILEKLFGSSDRIKIMKLFLLNPTLIFDKEDVVERTKVTRPTTNKEVSMLEKIGFIKKKAFTKEVTSKKTKKVSKKKVQGFQIRRSFMYYTQIHNLLVHADPINENSISKRLSKHGKIKLIITSGIFIQNDDSRVDLLVVGDQLKIKQLDETVAQMESEVGKELKYVILASKDFKYRIGVCDRLVRDILDFPHQVVVDKLGLEKL